MLWSGLRSAIGAIDAEVSFIEIPTLCKYDCEPDKLHYDTGAYQTVHLLHSDELCLVQQQEGETGAERGAAAEERPEAALPNTEKIRCGYIWVGACECCASEEHIDHPG